MRAEPGVLVTRPEGQADGLIRGLQAAGCRPVHLPLLRIEAIDPLPGPMRQIVQDLDRYDHVLFISANAARCGLACLDEFWPQGPAGQRYWAVGQSTAAVLEARGLEVDRPESDMTSEGLLAMPGLADLRNQRCLIVRGEGGREHLAAELRKRGAQVDALVCYRRAAMEHDTQELKARIGDQPVDVVLISSGEGVEHLSRLLRNREQSNLAGATLFAPSDRVAALARDLGWPRVRAVENASDAAMLAAVKQWRDARLREKDF
jgi:uroporphyrinogen-III synthase